ncbi:MAG: nitroreductase [Microbacteriaceae bacterium]|nr:nitroreductase [Microbacteriaceae bacterium]
MTVLDAVSRRRSHAKVTPAAPTHEQLLPLVAAAGTVADHASLRPWRLIELRGDARNRLGEAFVVAAGLDDESGAKLAAKPLRASLLIAVVAVHQPSFKVTEWEQDATASGVAHMLSLLLSEAGWGVMWRTGHQTRTPQVRAMHGLADNEQLLGWLYVGGLPEDAREGSKTRIDPSEFLTSL